MWAVGPGLPNGPWSFRRQAYRYSVVAAGLTHRRSLVLVAWVAFLRGSGQWWLVSAFTVMVPVGVACATVWCHCGSLLQWSILSGVVPTMLLLPLLVCWGCKLKACAQRACICVLQKQLHNCHSVYCSSLVDMMLSSNGPSLARNKDVKLD